VDTNSFIKSLRLAYTEVAHWRRNCFKVPSGNIGNSFVSELACLYFATGSALESVVMEAAMTMPILLLQMPHSTSKMKDDIACLERRLESWKDGDIVYLLEEGRTIQQRLPRNFSSCSEQQLAHSFANLMFKGKTHAALQLLSNRGKGDILHLDSMVDSKSVKDILKSKHPLGQPAHPDSIISGTPPNIHPVVFISITASLIHTTALHTRGAGGPSGLDAYGLHPLLCARP